MRSANGREVTELELERLKAEAAKELEEAGFRVTDHAVQATLNRLLWERRLEYPGEGRRQEPADAMCSSCSRSESPSDSEHGDRDDQSRSHSKKRARTERANLGRFFTRVPQEYIVEAARLLNGTRATDLYLGLLWFARGDTETWVAQETLGRLLGLSISTIRRARRRLEELCIITVAAATKGERSSNGKIIQKARGYVYRLNPPEVWDWELIDRLQGQELQS